jgi:hypothetical protein
VECKAKNQALWFSKIVLENAVGIQFHAMNYGKDMDISVTGGNMTLFSNSIFSNPPAAIRVKDNPLVQFHNCYTREGQPVEI